MVSALFFTLLGMFCPQLVDTLSRIVTSTSVKFFLYGSPRCWFAYDKKKAKWKRQNIRFLCTGIGKYKKYFHPPWRPPDIYYGSLVIKVCSRMLFRAIKTIGCWYLSGMLIYLMSTPVQFILVNFSCWLIPAGCIVYGVRKLYSFVSRGYHKLVVTARAVLPAVWCTKVSRSYVVMFICILMMFVHLDFGWMLCFLPTYHSGIPYVYQAPVGDIGTLLSKFGWSDIHTKLWKTLLIAIKF